MPFECFVKREVKSHKTVSTDHNFCRERRASIRGPSAYKPNALPLGQTGSHPRVYTPTVNYRLKVRSCDGWNQDQGRERCSDRCCLVVIVLLRRKLQAAVGPWHQSNLSPVWLVCRKGQGKQTITFEQRGEAKRNPKAEWSVP